MAGRIRSMPTTSQMRTAEQEAVLRSVRKLVDFWQIEADELAMDGPTRAPQVPATPVVKPPKYRHPRTDETWDGEGSQPEWLRLALTRQGYTVEELRECARRHAEASSESPAETASEMVPPTGIEPVSAP
ncbi:MAG: H-NS family nucleoid-associated regulatory protein [Aquabacterium sp.]